MLAVQDYDFYYYFVSFFCVVGGWIGICLFMYGKPTSVAMKWLTGTFVGYFIDLAILETLIAVIGRTENGTTDCCKSRGLYFDYDTYEKFYTKKLR